MTYKVVALYRFMPMKDLPALQKDVKAMCQKHNICGTILLAPEGINATIGGLPDDLDVMAAWLEDQFQISQGEVKFSEASKKPFMRMKVRLKKEIVTLRAPEADPNKQVGTYVVPKDWNDLITQNDVILIDTRNIYETKTGMFKGTIDPNILTFTQFKDFVAHKMDPAKDKKVAMFCTGGIRCEKASSYMLAHGFENVYHLKGGILKYLEEIPVEQSLWEGDCFVFDGRVAIGHGLKEGEWHVCYGCREPLSQAEMDNKCYEAGVSCPHCIDSLTPERATGLRMRNKQLSDDGRI